MSATPLDSRLAHLEGAFDQISDRLNSIDMRFEAVDRRFEGVERRLDDLGRRVDGFRDTLVARMDRQFFWLMGVLIVSIILPLADRFIAR